MTADDPNAIGKDITTEFCLPLETATSYECAYGRNNNSLLKLIIIIFFSN